MRLICPTAVLLAVAFPVLAVSEPSTTLSAERIEITSDDGKTTTFESNGEAVTVEVEAVETPDPAEERLKQLKREIETLKLEAQLRAQQLEAELAEAREENRRLKQAQELQQLRQRDELLPLELEKSRLELEGSLDQARRAAEAAPRSAELEELTTEQKLKQAKLAAELADLKAQTARLRAEQELASAERQAELAEAKHRQVLLSTKNEVLAQELRAARLEQEAAQAAAAAELAVAQAALQQRQADERLADLVQDELQYRDAPFVDGVLHVSDRRIALNGPIITGTADYVCDRIHYFNNEDPTKPIFLIIDNSPGGSVLQGYRIVEAIETSDAPIHVVVKSFAASMAAVITTLADHSYAYPNAIMLHHQMSAGAFGNMTDIEEQVEMLKEWESRLAVPVAEKMGVTPDEFKAQMYENNSRGDWEEFADRAVELKWVNHIVDEVREESVRQRPTGDAPRPWYFAFLLQDEHGRSYVNLPPLEPMDAYLLYNPRNFFRVDGRTESY